MRSEHQQPTHNPCGSKHPQRTHTKYQILKRRVDKLAHPPMYTRKINNHQLNLPTKFAVKHSSVLNKQYPKPQGLIPLREPQASFYPVCRTTLNSPANTVVQGLRAKYPQLPDLNIPAPGSLTDTTKKTKQPKSIATSAMLNIPVRSEPNPTFRKSTTAPLFITRSI